MNRTEPFRIAKAPRRRRNSGHFLLVMGLVTVAYTLDDPSSEESMAFGVLFGGLVALYGLFRAGHVWRSGVVIDPSARTVADYSGLFFTRTGARHTPSDAAYVDVYKETVSVTRHSTIDVIQLALRDGDSVFLLPYFEDYGRARGLSERVAKALQLDIQIRLIGAKTVRSRHQLDEPLVSRIASGEVQPIDLAPLREHTLQTTRADGQSHGERIAIPRAITHWRLAIILSLLVTVARLRHPLKSSKTPS